jgi:PRC-barrel domain
MDYEHRSDRFTAIEDQYAGYTVQDPNGEKIGKVDDLFLDENDQPEYFGVKMGFLGTSSTLIPADIATIDKERGFIEISQTKSTVQDGPAFDDDREITPEYENEVRSYYGLGAALGTEDRGAHSPRGSVG